MRERKKKTVMLTLTEFCNLNCTYCYEKNKSLKTMDYDVAMHILEKELTKEDGYDECEIQFFGGEPFVEFQLLKQICEELWSKNWNKKYVCFATTNGTLIHGEIQSWLKENRDKFTCGLSLDGIKKAHDINRCNSFDLIDIEFFKNTWPNQYAKMTISPQSLPYLFESAVYLHEQGFTFDNNLAYGVDWNKPELLEIMEQQLKLLADYYISHPRIIPCRLLGLNLENINESEHIDRWCGAGKGLKSYDVEGTLYPCQMFAPLSMEKEKSKKVLEINFDKKNLEDPACKFCSIYNVCPTCYGYNYSSTGDIAKRDEVLCKYTKLSILATSYLWANRIMKYSYKELNISELRYVQLTKAVIKVQKLFAGVNN